MTYVQVMILQSKIIRHLGQRALVVLGLIGQRWGKGNKLFLWVSKNNSEVWSSVLLSGFMGRQPEQYSTTGFRNITQVKLPSVACVTIKAVFWGSVVADYWGKHQDYDENRHSKRDDFQSKTLKLNLSVIRPLIFNISPIGKAMYHNNCVILVVRKAKQNKFKLTTQFDWECIQIVP